MKNADIPAIPVDGTLRGLSKREYFAAMAMQGLTSSPLETGKLSHAANKTLKVFVVEQAVAISDALLEELEKDIDLLKKDC